MRNNYFWIHLFITLFACFSANGQSLNTLGGGMNTIGRIEAIRFDASNNYLYVAGDIGSMDGIPCGNIAMWDGTSWSSLGGGMDGTVKSLALVGHNLIASGHFQHAGGVAVNNIALWNGSTWAPLGNGFNDWVVSVEFFNNTLYAIAAGTFRCALFSFDGANWNSENLLLDYSVNGMVNVDSTLLIYGSFSHVNNDTARGLVSFNGSTSYIYPLNGIGSINSIAFSDSSIYVAGNSRAARWQNSTWTQTTLGCAMNEAVGYVFDYNGNLYVMKDSATSHRVILINKVVNNVQQPFARILTRNTSGETLGSVLCSGNNLFIGSNYTHFGDSLAPCLIMFDGYEWTNPGKPSTYYPSENTSEVRSMVRDTINGDIIAAGKFYFAGNKFCANVARWNGIEWNPLDKGLLGAVRKLIYFNNELYAIGNYNNTTANKTETVAKWNGTEWVYIGLNSTGRAYDAIVFHNNLYICGSMDSLNGISVEYFAKFDGVNWSAGGSNLPNYRCIQSLCVYNDTIVAGLRGSYNEDYLKLSSSTWYTMPSSSLNPDGINSFYIYTNKLYSTEEYSSRTEIRLWNDSAWIIVQTLPATADFRAVLFELHGQLAVSLAGGRIYLYDGTTFNQVSNGSINILSIINDTPTRDFIGGVCAGYYRGGVWTDVKHIGTLDWLLPQITVSLDEDTICENMYGFFNASSQDIFGIPHWNFSGGFPDTLSGAWHPIIQYQNPGTYSTYLVYSNLLGTDTLFLPDITILPCLTSQGELSENVISAYPNPFSSIINIDSDKILKEIIVSDISGHIILQERNFQNRKLDLSGFAAGLYFMKCFSENSSKTFKILKQ